MSSSSYFPLRWESTGDQWWYASPIDLAAANGHYDVVRELLYLDTNLLIKLTSLCRIRRLETIWDDDESQQFKDVPKNRSQVAQKLFLECENNKKGGYISNNNSLIRAGYGGWLLYTAVSAGDIEFVKKLLERDKLLVFGEGEYGVTDVLYGAARSKNRDVFRLILDSAVKGRFSSNNNDLEEEVIDPVFKWDMMNRAVHAAARGGCVLILKEILGDCNDVLVYRDGYGSTILHSGSGRGQVEKHSAEIEVKISTSILDISSRHFYPCTRIFVTLSFQVKRRLYFGSPSSTLSESSMSSPKSVDVGNKNNNNSGLLRLIHSPSKNRKMNSLNRDRGSFNSRLMNRYLCIGTQDI